MTNIHNLVSVLSARCLRASLILLIASLAACSKEQGVKEYLRFLEATSIQEEMLSNWRVFPETLEVEGAEVPIDSTGFVAHHGALIRIGSLDVALEDIEARLDVVLHDYRNEVTELELRFAYSYEGEEGAIVEVSLIGEIRPDDPHLMNVVASIASHADADHQLGQWSAVFGRE